MHRPLWILALLVAPLPAAATHPLGVDDAGTLQRAERQLELESRPLGDDRGMAVSARQGLGPRLDAGLAMAWTETAGDGPVYEFVADLKWAPGYAHRWRPRPFARPDFALLVEEGQAKLSLAGISAGLSWEGSHGLLTVELVRVQPLDPPDPTGAGWAAAIGTLLPAGGTWQVAAGWRREGLRGAGVDRAVLGLVRAFTPGDLSLGLEFGERRGPDLRLGWTTLFGG